MYKFLTFLLVSFSFQAAFAYNPADPGIAKTPGGAVGAYRIPSDGSDTDCTDCAGHGHPNWINAKPNYDIMLEGSGPDYNSGSTRSRGADGINK
jgi:hypothetical protein